MTFVPCFLFIFLGAPYVERLRQNRGLSAALTGITAAVVGVIANLAVYFALHTLFAETDASGYEHFGLLVPVWSTVVRAGRAGTVVALVWSSGCAGRCCGCSGLRAARPGAHLADLTPSFPGRETVVPMAVDASDRGPDSLGADIWGAGGVAALERHAPEVATSFATLVSVRPVGVHDEVLESPPVAAFAEQFRSTCRSSTRSSATSSCGPR